MKWIEQVCTGCLVKQRNKYTCICPNKKSKSGRLIKLRWADCVCVSPPPPPQKDYVFSPKARKKSHETMENQYFPTNFTKISCWKLRWKTTYVFGFVFCFCFLLFFSFLHLFKSRFFKIRICLYIYL